MQLSIVFDNIKLINLSLFYSALSKDRILSSNSWPLRFFPITRPSLFRRYDCGIALMLYLLATGSFQKLRFETWVHGKLSSITACSHCSLVLSSETPIISKPASLYFLCNLTRFGFSILHGLHHAAQKSKSVTLLSSNKLLSVISVSYTHLTLPTSIQV